jgi:hypothetical protein
VINQASKAFAEAAGLLRGPQRIGPLVQKIVSDKLRVTFERCHLYSFTKTIRDSGQTLNGLLRWILDAQRPDGGIAAYYSLLTGYSESYPEVTGYIVPTLYAAARRSDGTAVTGATMTGAAMTDTAMTFAAERATHWLLSLQMPSGAFPGGIHGATTQPSVFNTGQILQGLVRAYAETNRPEVLRSASAAGDWLIEQQQPNGAWSGASAYQNVAHTYYSMVAWSLAELSEYIADRCLPDRCSASAYSSAAERNIDWTLSHFRSTGWVDGISLRGHPNYLHFIAYILQGVLECAILRGRSDAIDAVGKSAWTLLRKFETNKFLAGAYDTDFKNGCSFTCLTGNAQMSCVWLRLFELTGELRYLSAALKMNELLKQLISARGPRGISGGVSGSYPIWGRYQPMRYISWGCKFFADALLLEERMKQRVCALNQPFALKALPCAS